MSSGAGFQRYLRLGQNFEGIFLKKLELVHGFAAAASQYRSGSASIDLNAAQLLILSFLYGLFTEDVLFTTFIIDLAVGVEQLKSSYLRVWLRDDFLFLNDDVKKGIATLDRLISLGTVKVPESLVTVLSGIIDKYGINHSISSEEFLSESEREALDMRLKRAVIENNAAEIISATTRGANINLKTSSGESLYHLAVSYGCEESIAALGFLKANVEVRDSEMATPIQRAVACNNGRAVAMLAAFGANIKRRMAGGATLVHYAVSTMSNIALDALLKAGADLAVQNYNGETPCFIAVKKSNFFAVRLLLEKGTNPDEVAENGESILHIACAMNNLETVRELLKGGAKIDITNAEGIFPLHLSHNSRIIELLVSHGASLDVVSPSRDTALHMRAAEGNVEAVGALISLGASVNICNNEKQTPLMLAVIHERKETVKLLLSEGSDPNMQQEDGFTASHLAVISKNLLILQMLEADGANLKLVANDEYTVLHLAAFEGCTPIVDWLLSCEMEGLYSARCNFSDLCCPIPFNYDPDDECMEDSLSWTAVHLASFKGHLDTLKSLLLPDHIDEVNKADDEGMTPLHLAAFSGHVSVVRELLDHGADASFKNSCSQTAAHLAADQGHIDVVRLLVEEFHVDVDVQGPSSWTLLHLAAARGNAELVNFLLDHDANVDCKTEHGYTPLQLAERNNYSEVQHLICCHVNPLLIIH